MAAFTFALLMFAVDLVDAGLEGGSSRAVPRGLRASVAVNLEERAVEFRAAIGAVMGCGSTTGHERFSAIERVLQPIWRVLPKNRYERVEWKMLRYVAHRYFMQQSSLLIRGLEPAREVNSSHAGTAHILSESMPSFVDTILNGKMSDTGFSLSDAVAMIATLEQLIFNSETKSLESVYNQQGRELNQELTTPSLIQVIEEYMVNWMLDEDAKNIHRAMRDPRILQKVIPRWSEVSQLVRGIVRSREYENQRALTPRNARAAFTNLHSFDDAHQVVGQITKTFASWWEADCQSMKNSLIAMDRTGTGRVGLADFYGANMDGEWRFGESETYLRELGALDESSSWRGKQVIIPNYLQGASNCIVTKPHYLVCCINECEAILNDIEAALDAPVARPEEILPLVQNFSNFDDEQVKIHGSLEWQLQRIADTHAGQVPLHGRLFAQWLHYAFPYECPFPHRSGTVSYLSIDEYGNSSYAAADEIHCQAATRGNVSSDTVMLETVGEAQWMTQWSEEEELHADYTSHLGGVGPIWPSLLQAAPTGAKGKMASAAVVLFMLLLLTQGRGRKANYNKKTDDFGFGYQLNRAHMV